MKQLLIVALISAFSFGKIITIVDNGIKRKIAIPDNTISARATNSSLETKKELIISFAKEVDIKNFSKTYKLELKKKIGSKYYIFQNNSTLDDVSLMQKIIEDNSTLIKTIRPNWGFGFQAR